MLRLFVNGIEDSDFTTSYTQSLDQQNTSASGGAEELGLIGARIADGNTSTTSDFNGLMQDIRFSRGQSKYETGNFTPPSAPLTL